MSHHFSTSSLRSYDNTALPNISELRETPLVVRKKMSHPFIAKSAAPLPVKLIHLMQHVIR